MSTVKLSTVLSAMSYALDLTEGQPLGHAARRPAGLHLPRSRGTVKLAAFGERGVLGGQVGEVVEVRVAFAARNQRLLGIDFKDRQRLRCALPCLLHQPRKVRAGFAGLHYDAGR